MGTAQRKKQPAQKAPDHTQASHGLDRIVFFSDAVMAIAITLLVLDLRPAEATTIQPSELTGWVLSLWPKYLGYAVSFWVIALYWVAHHRCFRYIQRYDRRLIYLNFLFLMFAAFTPFPTAMLFSQPTGTASAILYAGTAAGMGFSLGGLWLYAARHAFIYAGIPPTVIRGIQLNLLLPSLVFVISAAVAPISLDVAMYSWLLLVPAYMFLRRREHSLMQHDLP